MPLLRCEGLVKDYPGKRAIDGVDFEVSSGEIVGLLGPNGAGKSTAFRVTCGLIAPTEGRVFLRDVDVTLWPMYLRAQHGMGYLPQDQSIFSRLSVEENIFAIMELRGESRRGAAGRVRQLLTDLIYQEFSALTKGADDAFLVLVAIISSIRRFRIAQEDFS